MLLRRAGLTASAGLSCYLCCNMKVTQTNIEGFTVNSLVISCARATVAALNLLFH